MVLGNEQVTTLDKLTKLSLSSYPFTKQYQQKPHHYLQIPLKLTIRAIQT